MIQLAWRWLRHQPRSALTLLFLRRAIQSNTAIETNAHALIDWQKRRGYPLQFACEATLNIAKQIDICPPSAPFHPQTQGKIDRWHQTLKNRILLEHYCLPGDLERQVAAFVKHYNHARYHESLGNLTPADIYFGRPETILLERERIKRQTIANRRLRHQLHAA